MFISTIPSAVITSLPSLPLENSFVFRFTSCDYTMEIQLILIIYIVGFGSTHVQRPNLMAYQGFTDEVFNNESKIGGNVGTIYINIRPRVRLHAECSQIEHRQFQNLFASHPKNDTKKNEIHHEILRKEVARKQQAFDAMKEELWMGINRNINRRKNFYKKNNTGKGIVATKQETNGNNHDNEFQTDNGNQKLNKILKNSPEFGEPTSQTHQNSIQDHLRRVRSGRTGQEFTNNHRNQTSLLTTYNWNVMDDVFGGAFSVVMLNTPITSPKFATSIWRRANFKILIDGGGNRLYDLLFNSSSINCSRHDLPHAVSGDFDSICPDVLNFFKKLNVKVVHTPDQEETDFFKGLKVLTENTSDRNVIVYCDTVGRLDHIMENLNTLFMCSSHVTLEKYNIFLLNHKSLTWLLRPGFHVIDIPPYLWTDKSYCGLIPVGQPCHHVTTKGLKYNLRDGEIQFGKMVSTSNGYDMGSGQTEVRISTDNKIVWTMTIDERICTDN